MLTAIGKLSKSFLLKIFVGIIILPFVFWGMGDVFRGGNQNVIASIDSEKISTQEFVDYLGRLNLNKGQLENLDKTDLLEKILAEYIGKRIMALEIEELDIVINDNSLRKIIKNDEIFFKEGKFSRTEYEKFLIKSGLSAPQFESNIVDQEKRRQFLSFLSSGITVPVSLIEKEYRKENQQKTIRYINLEKYHLKKVPSEKDKRELFERNKNVFFAEFKTLKYAQINPEKISGSKEYDENYFKKLDIIENEAIDGLSIEEISEKYSFKINLIKKINSNQEDENKKKISQLPDDLFQKIFNLKNTNSLEVISVGGKYYLAEISKIIKENKLFKDPDVQKALDAQLNFKNKIETNTSITKDISMGALDKKKFDIFATNNNLEIKNYLIKDLKQNEIFSEGIIKRIFLMKNDEIKLITNSTLTKNFIVLAVKTQYPELKKNSNEYEQYEAKARLNLINKIYQSHDINLNKKYNVELNQRTIERVKNSF